MTRRSLVVHMALVAHGWVAVASERSAYAQQAAEAPRAAPPEYVVPERPEPPPSSWTGIQAALRAGAAFPIGLVSSGRSMSELASAKLPLVLDLGWKPGRHIFLGGYASFALGGVTGRFEDDHCVSRDCAANSAHLGVQIQYHLRPAEEANPWVGYGIGYEWLWTSGYPETAVRGPEYGRFMLGMDFRLSRAFGIGPVVDATIGRYTFASVEQRLGAQAEPVVAEGDIEKTGFHSWVTIGVRAVAMP